MFITEHFWVCENCDSSNFHIKEKGPHIGLYCATCDKFIGWIPQNAIKKNVKKLQTDRGNNVNITIIDEIDTNDTPWI